MIDISEDNFSKDHSDIDGLLQNFVCLICYGVALDPVKCTGCETIYCSACLPKYLFDKSIKPKYHEKYSCHKKCGQNQVADIGRLARNVLNSFAFEC